MIAGRTTPDEREQLDALKDHQRAVRAHKAAKVRVTAAAEALARAEDDHTTAHQYRTDAKAYLADVILEA